MDVEITADEARDLEYERAFDRHWDDVFRFALAWTNDWAAAEDVAQETYLRLWKSRGSVDWSRPILPWLLVAARRLAANRFRALRRAVLPPGRGTEALDEAVRVRWLDARAALGGLTPLERSALLLTAVEGWSHAEVAGAAGTTEGAVAASIRRARQKLEVAR